jgi:hypothetical protein
VSTYRGGVVSADLFEDLCWREEHRHHPGLGRVGISQDEGDRIAFALKTTRSNLQVLVTASVNAESRTRTKSRPTKR